MTTIYLIRHGEYENPQYMFPGQSLEGFPLSQTGRMQVARRAAYLADKHIAALYSSPILRTRQTALIFSQEFSLPIVYDERLLEVKTMGEGLSMKVFDATNGELSYTPEYQARGAESLDQLGTRMQGFIEEKRIAHKEQVIAVVSHGDPIRAAVMKYRGLPMDFQVSRTVPVELAGSYRFEFNEADMCVVTQLDSVMETA